jgi:hypothetical protein
VTGFILPWAPACDLCAWPMTPGYPGMVSNRDGCGSFICRIAISNDSNFCHWRSK